MALFFVPQLYSPELSLSVVLSLNSQLSLMAHFPHTTPPTPPHTIPQKHFSLLPSPLLIPLSLTTHHHSPSPCSDHSPSPLTAPPLYSPHPPLTSPPHTTTPLTTQLLTLLLTNPSTLLTPPTHLFTTSPHPTSPHSSSPHHSPSLIIHTTLLKRYLIRPKDS